MAWPLANPWLVTRVSTRRTTGVSECRYAGMSDCAIPSTPAQALPLSGWVVRKSLSWFTSQLDTFCVPPYSPSVAPETTLVPLVVDVEEDGLVVAAAGGGALVGDVVYGSGPDDDVDCKSTGAAAAGLVDRTTARAVMRPTISAPMPIALGRRHQGRPPRPP